MNWVRSCKLQKNKGNEYFSGGKALHARAEPPDFSGVPIATVCKSIQLLIEELYGRGFPVYDFDNKNKFVQGIQIIQGKVYFLAAEPMELETEKKIDFKEGIG